MSKMPSSMAHSKKLFIVNNHQALKIQIIRLMYAAFEKLYIDLNKLLEHGFNGLLST
ncbi:unnamed protein product [Rhodiola kirilowii]